MSKTRLEAFSDGVIAIIITIMVLELKVPHSAELAALGGLAPQFASYLLSFVFIGIYWNNHHHLLQAAECVNGGILWSNLHLLFWLSLVPFVTNWMGDNGWAPWPIALYGTVLLFSGVAYFILCKMLVFQHGKHSALAKALGSDRKGLISLVTYAAAVPLAFIQPWISTTLYVLVALFWLIPDQRIEKALAVEKCNPD